MKPDRSPSGRPVQRPSDQQPWHGIRCWPRGDVVVEIELVNQPGAAQSRKAAGRLQSRWSKGEVDPRRRSLRQLLQSVPENACCQSPPVARPTRLGAVLRNSAAEQDGSFRGRCRPPPGSHPATESGLWVNDRWPSKERAPRRSFQGGPFQRTSVSWPWASRAWRELNRRLGRSLRRDRESR
jgi:hypothetical protein